MDIVTHAAMGAIVAGPFLTEHPLSAGGFMLGSALPDLDALSRLFGKQAFLRWHQTYTHALPLIGLGTALGWFLVEPLGREAQHSILAVGIAMTVHSLLDFSNTYGVKLLFPFTLSPRRRTATNSGSLAGTCEPPTSIRDSASST
jgi:membrane-bound metal-dependent hydrolase YbcI (DUF457 family)